MNLPVTSILLPDWYTASFSVKSGPCSPLAGVVHAHTSTLSTGKAAIPVLNRTDSDSGTTISSAVHCITLFRFSSKSSVSEYLCALSVTNTRSLLSSLVPDTDLLTVSVALSALPRNAPSLSRTTLLIVPFEPTHRQPPSLI